MPMDERIPARPFARIPSLPGTARAANGKPEMTRKQRPLLSLARKLHDNETRSRHYAECIPHVPAHRDHRESEPLLLACTRLPRTGDPEMAGRERDRRGWTSPSTGSWISCKRWFRNIKAEWESDSAPFFSVSYNYNNGFFETVDAEIAYCMVRHYKPRRIVEVGGRLQQPRHGCGPRSKSQSGRSARRTDHN